jgi:hypothetical protein
MDISTTNDIKEVFKNIKKKLAKNVLISLGIALIFDPLSLFIYNTVFASNSIILGVLGSFFALTAMVSTSFTIWVPIQLFLNKIDYDDISLNIKIIYQQKRVNDILNLLISMHLYILKTNSPTTNLTIEEIKDVNVALIYNKILLEKFEKYTLPEEKIQKINHNEHLIKNKVTVALKYILKYDLINNKKFQGILNQVPLNEKMNQLNLILTKEQTIEQLEQKAKKESQKLTHVLTPLKIKTLSL